MPWTCNGQRRKVNLVLPCVATKKWQGPSMLDMHIFSTMPELHAAWCLRLQDANLQRGTALDLYAGKNWETYMSCANYLAELFDLDIYVVSAGLGLIKITQDVPSYDASFSPGNALKPTKRVQGGGTKAAWWNLFEPLLPDRYTIAALPISYVQMARDTLLGIKEGVLITGWAGDIPTALQLHPIQKVSCLTDLSVGAASRHSETFRIWVSSILEKAHG
jgi:hypothetical protein